jgi:hypothetical protein
VDANVYPDSRAWYQPFLPFPEGVPGYGTAADAVYHGFPFAELTSLEARYLEAAARLDLRKARTALLTEQHGFEDKEGKKHICPRMLEALLDVLPEDEPLAGPRGPGGAPRIPFDSFLRAFVFAPSYEVEDNSAAIWRAVANNPMYLCRCRFPGNELPDLRSFQRFNEVMNVAGLWGEARRLVVAANLSSGALKAPTRLAIDPGHEDGYASVRRPCQACRLCGGCPKEEQVCTCDVTDIVAKRKTCQFPGVKGVFVTDPDQEMPLLSHAVNARVHDGRTGAETARAFAAEYPELVGGVQEASLDGAFDAREVKEEIAAALGGAEVLTPINPRARKPETIVGTPGIDHIDPYGIPHCIQGVAMAFLGRDLLREDFIWGCPAFDRQTGCLDCENRGRCCPNPGKAGRRYRVPREKTPQVDWDNPQHSQDFRDRYAGRTAVERTIGRTKRSFPFERHWGRGRAAFQGHLDKGVLAFHVLLAAAHALGLPHKGRSPLTFHERDERAA